MSDLRKIPIPVEWMGKEIEGSIEKVLSGNREAQGKCREENVQVGANINLNDYIKVPSVKGIHGGQVLISKFEIPDANNLDYEETHKFVLEKGLYVPTPAIFMPHFTNVVKTYNNNGTLFDGDGNPIDRSEHEEIYKHLTMNHIATYGKETQKGAWTWLNVRFVLESVAHRFDLETVLGLDSNRDLITRRENLQDCLGEDDCYVSFDWNDQGLSMVKSGSQSYVQGENVYFWHPTDGAVAWFVADSDWAGLYCDGDPTVRVTSLGVFSCAEGTVANLGGNQ